MTIKFFAALFLVVGSVRFAPTAPTLPFTTPATTMTMRLVTVWRSFLRKPGRQTRLTNHRLWPTILALDQALVHKDAARLKTLLTDDFVGIIPSGTLLNKTDYIHHHCQPNRGLMGLEEYPMTQALIRRYGPVAVVSRSVQAQLRRPDGQLIRVKVQRLEVCVREAGTWRVARGQGTEVNPFLRP